jgi:LEA14-like dessication related protein
MPTTLCSIRLLMGLITLVFTACSTLPRDIEPPRMNIVNIAPKDIAIFEQRYDVQLRILNPNDADLGIKGMRFDIELNDQEFASGMSGQKVTVPRFGSEVVNVEVTSGLSSLVRQVEQMNKTGMNKIRYRIKGTAFVESPGNYKAPFDEKGEIDFTSPSPGDSQ